MIIMSSITQYLIALTVIQFAWLWMMHLPSSVRVILLGLSRRLLLALNHQTGSESLPPIDVATVEYTSFP